MSLVHQLYRLQKIDTELQSGKKRLGEVLKAQQEPPTLIAARQRAATAAETLQNWRATQKDQELELGSIDAKSNRSTQRLYSGKVANPKELEDLQREVESLGRRRSTLEDEFLETMVMVEESETEQAAADTALAQMEREWGEKVAKLKQEQHQIALRVNELLQMRQQQASTIETKALQRYETILKKRGGTAVALFKNEVCQGCQTGLPSNAIKAVNEGQYFNCPHCGRILVAA